MKKSLLVFCWAFWLIGLHAQPSGVQTADLPPMEMLDSIGLSKLAYTITAADLREHLTILASDEYEGRETGTEGNEKAADYIARYFQQLGLPAIGPDDSYYQPVSFSWNQWKDIEVSVNGKKFRHLWDFLAFPTANQDQGVHQLSDILFLGYGIDDPAYSDYKGVDVKDKVILIYKGEPKNKSGESYLTGNKTESDWSTDLNKKLRLAKEKGVRTVLVIENELQKILSKNRSKLLGPQVVLGQAEQAQADVANHLLVSTTLAKAIMGKQFKKVVKARKKIKKKGRAYNRQLNGKYVITQVKNDRSLRGNNVLGFVEGTDPKLKEEIVIVTAHYDHLGRRGDAIYNGADDNGSGTSTVLEVAQAFAMAKKQGQGSRRSVLFMLVTGEEKGLLGSEYYTKKPIFPLEQTIANVNVDMVGRVDKKHQDDPNYIYVIGSDRLSSDLHQINEDVNQRFTQLELDYTYNAEDDPNRYYYRSDHYNFARNGIPAIFYFNGTHADYHRTTDTVEKIEFDKMARIGQLVFHTTWELANRAERIRVDKQQP